MAGQKIEEKIGKRGRAAVVVLGDIGRSPRMQYHALSLARQTQLQVPRGLPKMLYPVILLCKALTQFFLLLWFLCCKIPAPDVFIVQNPPSVPTLVAVKWASWLRHSAIIVDWHNFGYTLLGLSMGRSSPFVKVYRWIEKHYGKMADGSLCVTQAMQHELAQNWDIKATVLYDQPPDFFHPASLEERHELFCRLRKDISQHHGFRDFVSAGYKEMGGNVVNENIFTYQVDSDIRLKSGRPVIVVSSTSWTADEDFGMLLEAAVMYDRRISAILDKDDSKDDGMVSEVSHREKDCIYPRLLFIITGKGPEREKYEEQIKRLHLKRVAFRTMWLAAEDYPLLLGSADLGVCLHTSSSGLDLPMKVVDMFGCGFPVCAVSFTCIEELVKDGKNGLLFSSSSELADKLLMLLKGFPEQCDALKSLKNGVLERGSSARLLRRVASEYTVTKGPFLT
ncbi:hypothetical protein C5167_013568 [Papaver somniferum]|uniref:Uncharacterized protein n=1 Tax=Papaver somniferum TaxID=3469 RepID=A0A4Y7J0P9_PAPSO|nr:hypothetical protein C5167_013568 [Papaver somniferum]